LPVFLVFQLQLLSQLLLQCSVACPLFPKIISGVPQPFCFGVGFSLCWFTEGLFLCLAPFLWGKFSDPSAVCLLSVCCHVLLTVFQFCSVILLWMLLTGSGDDLCGPLPALFQAAAHHLPALCPSAFLFHHLFTDSSCGDQVLAPPPFPVHLQHPNLLICVSF
jgi:hypothetical protein